MARITFCNIEQWLATAATNGAVVLWNIQKSIKLKQETVYNDHKRTVNKVTTKRCGFMFYFNSFVWYRLHFMVQNQICCFLDLRMEL